jgi:hypothetical protein
MNLPDWRQQEESERREQAERKWSEHEKQASELEQLRRDIEAIKWSKTA